MSIAKRFYIGLSLIAIGLLCLLLVIFTVASGQAAFTGRNMLGIAALAIGGLMVSDALDKAHLTESDTSC